MKPRILQPLAIMVLTWLVCIAATGCASVRKQGFSAEAAYGNRNVFASAPGLPQHVRRVAVLPLTTDQNYTESLSGRDALEPVVIAEFSKTGKFDVTQIAPENLRSLTGRESWSDADVLPARFFEEVQQATGCDAVLFCRLTVFRAYPPLAVGWRFRLVDARTKETIWAGDEVFDAGIASIRNAAKSYARREQNAGRREWVEANSPRVFGQFTVARLFDTLPER